MYSLRDTTSHGLANQQVVEPGHDAFVDLCLEIQIEVAASLEASISQLGLVVEAFGTNHMLILGGWEKMMLGQKPQKIVRYMLGFLLGCHMTRL